MLELWTKQHFFLESQLGNIDQQRSLSPPRWEERFSGCLPIRRLTLFCRNGPRYWRMSQGVWLCPPGTRILLSLLPQVSEIPLPQIGWIFNIPPCPFFERLFFTDLTKSTPTSLSKHLQASPINAWLFSQAFAMFSNCLHLEMFCSSTVHVRSCNLKTAFFPNLVLMPAEKEYSVTSDQHEPVKCVLIFVGWAP